MQQPAASLDWLTVDLWPDFDQASVLVLLTGSLAAETPLPATITLPFPQDATLNAVARITDDNEMIDDIEFEKGDGTITLTTPAQRFRVEYYMPYEANGLQRTFVFNWSGGRAVSQLDVSVQQPRAATSMTVVPDPESVIEGNDGLQYHDLPVRQLQAAESYTVEVSYTLSSAQLTAPGGADSSDVAASAPPAAGEAAVNPPQFNLPLILSIAGVALILVAIGWQVFGARLKARRAPRKPRPLRAMRGEGVQFCHQCGAKARPSDRFCRECGTELKKG